jgi:antitoxin ParD1/3/4
MNISLTPELERRISEKIDSGLYSTASEVVRDALRRLFESETERERLIGQLNAELQEGLDQLDLGKSVGSAEAYRRVTEVIERRRRGK